MSTRVFHVGALRTFVTDDCFDLLAQVSIYGDDEAEYVIDFTSQDVVQFQKVVERAAELVSQHEKRLEQICKSRRTEADIALYNDTGSLLPTD